MIWPVLSFSYTQVGGATHAGETYVSPLSFPCLQLGDVWEGMMQTYMILIIFVPLFLLFSSFPSSSLLIIFLDLLHRRPRLFFPSACSDLFSEVVKQSLRGRERERGRDRETDMWKQQKPVNTYLHMHIVGQTAREA